MSELRVKEDDHDSRSTITTSLNRGSEKEEKK